MSPIFCQFLCAGYILTLSRLVSTEQQNYYTLVFLYEIDSIARAVVHSQFKDAPAHMADVSKVTR